MLWSNAVKVFDACPLAFRFLFFIVFLYFRVFSYKQIVQDRKYYRSPHFASLEVFLFDVFVLENSKTFLVMWFCTKGEIAKMTRFSRATD